MAKEYDVVVLGAGPGGYVAAIRAAQLGLKVAIVEKQYWGGVCLNIGCIPSKALLKNAEVAHTLQHRGKDFGFSFDNLKLDYSAAFKRSRQVADGRVKGVGFLMKKNKIDAYDGWGTIKDTKTLTVALNAGGEESLAFKNLIIATGAKARMIPSVQADGKTIITYVEAIQSDSVPKEAVIGAELIPQHTYCALAPRALLVLLLWDPALWQFRYHLAGCWSSYQLAHYRTFTAPSP